MKKRTCIFVGIAILLLALIIWTAWGNTALELNTYTVSSEALPDVFDGYRIAHVSDLHNAEMGDGNEKLLAMVRVAIQNFLKNPVISTVFCKINYPNLGRTYWLFFYQFCRTLPRK